MQNQNKDEKVPEVENYEPERLRVVARRGHPHAPWSVYPFAAGRQVYADLTLNSDLREGGTIAARDGTVMRIILVGPEHAAPDGASLVTITVEIVGMGILVRDLTGSDEFWVLRDTQAIAADNFAYDDPVDDSASTRQVEGLGWPHVSHDVSQYEVGDVVYLRSDDPCDDHDDDDDDEPNVIWWASEVLDPTITDEWEARREQLVAQEIAKLPHGWEHNRADNGHDNGGVEYDRRLPLAIYVWAPDGPCRAGRGGDDGNCLAVWFSPDREGDGEVIVEYGVHWDDDDELFSTLEMAMAQYTERADQWDADEAW